MTAPPATSQDAGTGGARVVLPIASARQTSALAWELVGPRRLPLSLAASCVVGAGVAGIAAPWLIGDVVDAVRAGEPSVVARSAVLLALAAVAAGVFTAFSTGALASALAPALATLRERVLDRALQLDSVRLEAAGPGDVLSRVGGDVETLSETLDRTLPLLVTSVVAIAFTGLGLFALDWRLGLCGLAAVPLYVFALRWYLPRSGPLYRAERLAKGERAQALVTGLHGAATARTFGREEADRAEIDRRSRATMDLSVGVFDLTTRLFGRVNRAECVGLGLVLVAGFLLVRAEAVTVGAATAAALYFHRLFNPIGAVLLAADGLQSASASLARMAGVALLPAALEARPVDLGDAGLSLHEVTHAYEPGRPVLHGIDLRIGPGERVALVGASGAGKSTLGGIVARRIVPTTGSVRIGGVDIDAFDEASIRRQVVLVSQEVHVFAGTVRDNLTLAIAPGNDPGDCPSEDPPDDGGDERLWRALDVTGCAGWVRTLPAGLDTVVGHLGHPLTAAQAQQLALTRVELCAPAVVVLDEATAEARSSGARELDAAALAVTRGRAALVVAHRLNQARDADRILVMADGRVVEEGTHEELVAADGRYAELWRAWSR